MRLKDRYSLDYRWMDANIPIIYDKINYALNEKRFINSYDLIMIILPRLLTRGQESIDKFFKDIEPIVRELNYKINFHDDRGPVTLRIDTVLFLSKVDLVNIV